MQLLIKILFAHFLTFVYFVSYIKARNLDIIGIDENWICSVKRSCQECVRLSQCSWCSTDSKCFSERLSVQDNYCNDGIIHQTNLSLSYDDNAECACAGDTIVKNCRPPDEDGFKECSGRGSCHCGRCFCDTPDIANPNKVIIGEYCEFDNFSCDGPKCNEGPYSINDLENYEEDNPGNSAPVDIPEE